MLAITAAMSAITKTIASCRQSDLNALVEKIKYNIEDHNVIEVLNQVVLIARTLGDSLSIDAKCKVLQEYAVSLIKKMNWVSINN